MEERYQHNESLIHQLRGNLIQIQHAESSLLKQSNLATIKVQLDHIESEINTLYDEQAELENHFEELLSKKSDTKHSYEELKNQWAIYEELGEIAEQQLNLQKLEQEVNLLKTKIDQLENKRNEVDEKANDKNLVYSRIKSEYQQKLTELRGLENAITRLCIKNKKSSGTTRNIRYNEKSF